MIKSFIVVLISLNHIIPETIGKKEGLPSSLVVLRTLKDRISDLLDLLSHSDATGSEKYINYFIFEIKFKNSPLARETIKFVHGPILHGKNIHVF